MNCPRFTILSLLLHNNPLFTLYKEAQTKEKKEEGEARPLNYDYMNRPRTQDAPQDHVENGAIYIFKPQTIRKYGQRLGGKIVAYKMSPLHSFDVDDYDDLKIANIICSSRM